MVKQLFTNLPTCDTIHNIQLLIKGSLASTWAVEFPGKSDTELTLSYILELTNALETRRDEKSQIRLHLGKKKVQLPLYMLSKFSLYFNRIRTCV